MLDVGHLVCACLCFPWSRWFIGAFKLSVPALDVSLHATALAGAEVEDSALAIFGVTGGFGNGLSGGTHGSLRLSFPGGGRRPLEAASRFRVEEREGERNAPEAFHSSSLTIWER